MSLAARNSCGGASWRESCRRADVLEVEAERGLNPILGVVAVVEFVEAGRGAGGAGTVAAGGGLLEVRVTEVQQQPAQDSPGHQGRATPVLGVLVPRRGGAPDTSELVLAVGTGH